ncbi:MAG: hypothetical protein HYV29_11355 [Ignavibacteriales bacterium]|nr:hypothetical protein [Ignavibacteriales bacterium]
MGLGQTLLTIMALMLMGRLILTVNRTTLDTGFTKDMAEYRITATSLGTSLLESANSLAFDEATVDTFLLSTQISSLTADASFGPDAGETSYTLFDDIDDYDHYTRIDTLSNSAIFKIYGLVQYLDVSGSTLSITTSKKFNKLITVFVTSDYLVDYSVDPPKPDTLKFESVFSYWYFR